MRMSRYSISDAAPTPSPSELYQVGNRTLTTRNDLVVCGNLTFISGAVMAGGNALYVGSSSVVMEPMASVYSPGRFVHASECPLDFDDLEARLSTFSLGLASLPRTGTSVIEYT